LIARGEIGGEARKESRGIVRERRTRFDLQLAQNVAMLLPRALEIGFKLFERRREIARDRFAQAGLEFSVKLAPPLGRVTPETEQCEFSTQQLRGAALGGIEEPRERPERAAGVAQRLVAPGAERELLLLDTLLPSRCSLDRAPRTRADFGENPAPGLANLAQALAPRRRDDDLAVDVALDLLETESSPRGNWKHRTRVAE
jgi:hypothetical protein